MNSMNLSNVLALQRKDASDAQLAIVNQTAFLGNRVPANALVKQRITNPAGKYRAPDLVGIMDALKSTKEPGRLLLQGAGSGIQLPSALAPRNTGIAGGLGVPNSSVERNTLEINKAAKDANPKRIAGFGSTAVTVVVLLGLGLLAYKAMS